MSDGFFAELKRRNVIRMAGLYLAAGWVAIEVAGTVLPMLDAPVTRLTVEGDAFTVRHNLWRAEAVRTSTAAAVALGQLDVLARRP